MTSTKCIKNCTVEKFTQTKLYTQTYRVIQNFFSKTNKAYNHLHSYVAKITDYPAHSNGIQDWGRVVEQANGIFFS